MRGAGRCCGGGSGGVCVGGGGLKRMVIFFCSFHFSDFLFSFLLCLFYMTVKCNRFSVVEVPN